MKRFSRRLSSFLFHPACSFWCPRSAGAGRLRRRSRPGDRRGDPAAGPVAAPGDRAARGGGSFRRRAFPGARLPVRRRPRRPGRETRHDRGRGADAAATGPLDGEPPQGRGDALRRAGFHRRPEPQRQQRQLDGKAVPGELARGRRGPLGRECRPRPRIEIQRPARPRPRNSRPPDERGRRNRHRRPRSVHPRGQLRREGRESRSRWRCSCRARHPADDHPDARPARTDADPRALRQAVSLRAAAAQAAENLRDHIFCLLSADRRGPEESGATCPSSRRSRRATR